MAEILIRNGRVIDPANGVDGPRFVLIRDGKVAEVAERLPVPPGCEVVDASGQWVIPGLVDLHVHLREPGEEYKETIQTGTRAAVAGGFTSVVAMPNTKPVNDNAAVTEYVLRKAQEAQLARVYPAGAITQGLLGEQLSEMGELAQAGCRAFTDDGRPVMNPALMRRALEYGRIFDLPLMVHEEDLLLAGKGVMHEGVCSTRLGLSGIPAAAEIAMVQRDLLLAEATAGRVHFAHLSCRGSVEAVRAAKKKGLRVSAEAAPHHFTLTDAAVAGYDTDAKMNPPLREDGDRLAVCEGLADGTIDAIATDHAPHSLVEKQVEFPAAANGVVGLETALPLTLELVRSGALSVRRAIELLTVGPARAFGLPAGTLSVGAPADLTLIDPEQKWTVDPSTFYSKSRNTPFKGRAVQGRVKRTYVAGRLVHEDQKGQEAA